MSRKRSRGKGVRERNRRIRAAATVCAICGGEFSDDPDPFVPRARTIDHIVPLALGGSNKIENLRVVHRFCNQREARAMMWNKPYVKRAKANGGESIDGVD